MTKILVANINNSVFVYSAFTDKNAIYNFDVFIELNSLFKKETQKLVNTVYQITS